MLHQTNTIKYPYDLYEQTGVKNDLEVTHSHEPHAVQFEFYFPAKIWSLKTANKLMKKIDSLLGSKGATVFKGLIGVWKYDNETQENKKTDIEDIHIYRVIMVSTPKHETIDLWDKVERDGLRDAIQEEVGKTMANFVELPEMIQYAFLFTETNTVFAISEIDPSSVKDIS